jgi:D-3-phosphoglycerate dehydrogenase / 2-oxoglutarate reductase
VAYKVLIPQGVDQSGIDALSELGYHIRMGSGITPEILKDEIADCDALYLRTAIITREILEHAGKLKVISRYGVGVDNIDLKAAEELGIWVTNSPVANVTTVAEHTIGFIVACARNFYRGDLATRTGDFEYRNRDIGFDIAGKTLGLLGIGKIASEVARRARLGLDMNVIAYDPYADRDRLPEGVDLVEDREALFRSADFISVHVPATAETRGSIGAEEFSMMKKTAYFINCGRGLIVREEDLVAALQNDRIAGAALDVFNPEPPAGNNPLFALKNVILSPHNAGLTQEAAVRISMDAVRGIDDVLNGRRPEFAVIAPKKSREVL